MSKRQICRLPDETLLKFHTSKKRWCSGCSGIRMFTVQNELFTRKGQRKFDMVCPDCGLTRDFRWGKDKTARYIKALLAKLKSLPEEQKPVHAP